MRLGVLAALLAALGFVWLAPSLAQAGPRTVNDVLASVGPKRRPALERRFHSAGVAYPPANITLVAYKQERLLEIWAPRGAERVRVLEYPILAASGQGGPKLRQGDEQVPEGVYRLSAFNPNSRFHLSIRVDYPSARDRSWARLDGRSDLGGDIFIHGKAVSRGCIAIGDAGIEELFTLVADTGLRNSTLIIAPNQELRDLPTQPAWVGELYEDVRKALATVHGTH
jgi:hypothetical protein